MALALSKGMDVLPAVRLFLVTLELWPGSRKREPVSNLITALEALGLGVRVLGRNMWLVKAVQRRACSIVDALQPYIDVRDRVIVACVEGAEIDGRFSVQDRSWLGNRVAVSAAASPHVA